ncbi:hypothetical protein BDV28DRAFT_155334 [Aspergillus coremiiformis]|uniref:SUN domain-containing protein n=1 Tax=Aspergillus coremiiformis TaxID=138285 RepID=A0A5N6ZD05_9EURO|nr:hypothetical protein BDV28DRAFT_155334 [Aspergillus coremiiformis]
MPVPAWATATWTSLTTALILPGVQGTGVESGQPICLARHWREVESEFVQWPICVDTKWERTSSMITQDVIRPPNQTVSVTVSSSGTATPTSDGLPDHELDTDSPLDNANFLSFEDWKKQNLAKVGQSAENVRGNRHTGGKEDLQRPAGINNALDSLGEDAEIELDFGGFGADASEAAQPTSWGSSIPTAGINAVGAADAESSVSGDLRKAAPRGKDAGTTCKERFNYASFDCAATVLKTNPECKGSSSVLVENKDSYMLNECRARNKFLILELCDDILVDTVVLANYEFFSSIFHTFRVSVADRYPPKPDQWRELGVYEARNTREIQAFAVENPLIWARYLKIEFLTHYGNEFYCPLSLVRVHGTTMLEEYKHDGDANRGDEEALESSTVPVNIDVKDTAQPPSPVTVLDNSAYEPKITLATRGVSSYDGAEVVRLLQQGSSPTVDTCCDICAEATKAAPESGNQSADSRPKANQEAPLSTEASAPVSQADPAGKGPVAEQKATGSPGASTDSASSTVVATETTPQGAVNGSDVKPASFSKEELNIPPESVRPSGTQAPSPNPTTQESFFKSVNKRLQMLESNSTLSLLYIEEQSRILRDAFNKVEKRQLAKTSTFLENLNVTVLNELRQFREQYDQVWKSVALEFEHQRIQYHQEIYSISAQLGVLADELVFQKRVSVIQSIMILFCFALVLFSRGPVSTYIDIPRVQNMMTRSYSLRPSSPIFGSPSVSPSSTRAMSSYRSPARHRRNISEDSQEGRLSSTIAYAPPTPTTSDPSSPEEAGKSTAPSLDPLRLSDLAPPHFRSCSSPPVLKAADEEDQSDESPGSYESQGSSDAAPAQINSMEYHRQVLQGKLDNGDKQQASYVSPSDDIMSPCSKKLSDLKGKRFKKYVEQFVEKECIPAEKVFQAQLGEGDQRWTIYPPIIETLKTKARQQGLWNMFLPKNHFAQGAGFTNLEYGLMAEYLGKSKLASEATNNAAPDTGNMEVLAKYGNDAQKQQWLTPLLDGQIRSAFLMTEPEVASSDATNIQLSIRRDGNEYVLNGSKWWSSGAGDPRCKIYLVMGKSDPTNRDSYRQQSVLLVPADTPGITVHRMLSVYGYDDAPHGHGHISFTDVRVPVSSIVLGEGRGFEIIQGRLGPGRIHHAMRTIGAAEKALEWLIARINDDRKRTFGQQLSAHGVILEWVAKSRIEIDAARLVVLNAAIKIDGGDAKSALKEIAQAKVLVPQMALTVIDRAVQAYGAAGVCQDTPLANLWAMIRTLRIADGPDEVHLQQLGKRESRSRKDAIMEKLEWQRMEGERLLAASGLKLKSHL